MSVQYVQIPEGTCQDMYIFFSDWLIKRIIPQSLPCKIGKIGKIGAFIDKQIVETGGYQPRMNKPR